MHRRKKKQKKKKQTKTSTKQTRASKLEIRRITEKKTHENQK